MDDGWDGFPGLYRPGLIEVAPGGMAESGRRKSFRGFTAPASLKYGFRAHQHLDAPGFRGFTAPASLKSWGGRTAALPPAVFPGLYRPGLIEVC